MDGPEYNLLNKLLGKCLVSDRSEGDTGKINVRVPSTPREPGYWARKGKGWGDNKAGCLKIVPAVNNHPRSAASQFMPGTLTILILWEFRITACNLVSASEMSSMILQSMQQR